MFYAKINLKESCKFIFFGLSIILSRQKWIMNRKLQEYVINQEQAVPASASHKEFFFINLQFIRVSFTIFIDIQICAVFESRQQLIKHVEIIYIEPIYLSVGVIKSRSSYLFQAVCVCFFFFCLQIYDCRLARLVPSTCFSCVGKNDLRHSTILYIGKRLNHVILHAVFVASVFLTFSASTFVRVHPRWSPSNAADLFGAV